MREATEFYGYLIELGRREQLRKARLRDETLKRRRTRLWVLQRKQITYEILGAMLGPISACSLFLLVHGNDSIWVDLGALAIIMSFVALVIQNKRLRKLLR